MEDYLYNRQAVLLTLALLFCLSLVDVVLRATVFRDDTASISNYGEPLVTGVLSVLLVLFALKGKERVFYILCGGWLAYFVLNQLFGLPETLSSLISILGEQDVIIPQVMSIILRLLCMTCIIVIGGLAVEYLDDGTIYERAFNILCVATVLFSSVSIVLCVRNIIVMDYTSLSLAVLNNIHYIAMVVLFIHFAYASAKAQLDRTRL